RAIRTLHLLRALGPACTPGLKPAVITGVVYAFFGRLAPYLERDCLRSLTPCRSSEPRTMWYRTPGRSLTRPPRTSTTLCSCRLWPSPPMYEMISNPFVSRTLATLRSAEFGFLGVVV